MELKNINTEQIVAQSPKLISKPTYKYCIIPIEYESTPLKIMFKSRMKIYKYAETNSYSLGITIPPELFGKF